MNLNIYLVSRTDVVSYDEYAAFVVACSTEDEARNSCPCGNEASDWKRRRHTMENEWADVSTLKVTLIGKAIEQTKPGVILASYKAG